MLTLSKVYFYFFLKTYICFLKWLNNSNRCTKINLATLRRVQFMCRKQQKRYGPAITPEIPFITAPYSWYRFIKAVGDRRTSRSFHRRQKEVSKNSVKTHFLMILLNFFFFFALTCSLPLHSQSTFFFTLHISHIWWVSYIVYQIYASFQAGEPFLDFYMLSICLWKLKYPATACRLLSGFTTQLSLPYRYIGVCNF